MHACKTGCIIIMVFEISFCGYMIWFDLLSFIMQVILRWVDCWLFFCLDL